MRKYMSKTDKVKLYAEKHKISEQEVYRILSEHEDMLTYDELKIKYDDPNLGKLPDWLSEEDLSKMIWKTIHSYWSPIFEYNTTKEDLYMEHQIYIRLKMSQLQNHNHVKSALVKRMIRLAGQEYPIHSKHFLGSLDEPALFGDSDSVSDKKKFEVSSSDEITFENNVFIEKIRGIKNKQVRDLLVITGYLLCNIEELRLDYLHVLRSSDEITRQNIQRLEYEMDCNEGVVEEAHVSKKKTYRINDIMQAMNINFYSEGNGDKKQIISKSLKELRKYLSYLEIF